MGALGGFMAQLMRPVFRSKAEDLVLQPFEKDGTDLCGCKEIVGQGQAALLRNTLDELAVLRDVNPLSGRGFHRTKASYEVNDGFT